MEALADFDVHLASQGKELADVLNGPQARQNFIKEKQAICTANPEKRHLTTVLNMWREAAFPETPVQTTLIEK